MKKENCNDCYYNGYNHGFGGVKECWYFKTAKLIWRKEVHIDQIPPWNQKAKRFPNCYRRSRYVYVSPERIN